MSLDSIFGGGGGGGGRINTPLSSVVTTPGFRLSNSFDPEGSRGSGTAITRLGTPEQRAFDKRFPRILSDLDELRGTITPGASLVRQARLDEVENARRRAVGNLRDNLARRRVLGSSFANDAMVRAEREFSQEAQAAQAQSFLEEFEMNSRILSGELSTVLSGLQREFAELGIASGSANAWNQLQAEAAKAAAELAAQESAGIGGLIGSVGGFVGEAVLGPAFDQLGTKISTSLFGNNTTNLPRLAAPSDRRLKRDIHPAGRLANGLRVYTFRYLWSPAQRIGVMADEVLKVRPDAVHMMPNGYMAVDYARVT